MFFWSFQISHLVYKQAYKFELFTKWKIHNVLHLILLQQDKLKKKQVNKIVEIKFDKVKYKEYKVTAIEDSIIHNKAAKSQLLELYY